MSIPPIVPPHSVGTDTRPADALAAEAGGGARRPRRVGLAIGIAAAVLGVLALVGGGVWFLITLVIGALGPTAPDQPLVTGDPATGEAARPLVCEGPCFTEDSLTAMTAPDDMFERLGLLEATYPAGTYDPATVGELIRQDQRGWEAYDGGPDACFFAPTSAPYATSYERADPENTDPVHFLGTHEDRDFIDMADQSARVFPDTAAATAYLADLSARIAECERVEIGSADDRYSASISPAPAFALPDEVAAVGWVREGTPGPRWRAYVVDLQRGNVVVRLRLLTDGVITENQFRNTVEWYAKQLATVGPVGATVSP